jgi:hypothetical protein
MAESRKAPWVAQLDFGASLRPHELVAVAIDQRGDELARVRRVVNLPQPAARADILVVRDLDAVPRSIRVVSTSVVGDRPESTTAELDGVPLSLSADGRADLPVLNLDLPHVISATVEYTRNVTARADVALGGVSEDAFTSLSAVPIRVAGGVEVSAASLRGGLTCESRQIEPWNVEVANSTVLFVRHPSSLEAARTLGRPKIDYPLKFGTNERVGYIWPLSQSALTGPVRSQLFESTPLFVGHDGGYFWLLTRVSRPGRLVPSPFRFADAVAVAGMEAFASRTRRAVVLVLGDDLDDASQFSASQVRDYLSSLGVPLHVWSLGRHSRGSWGDRDIEDISSFVGLELAVGRLKNDLEGQRIVWVRGTCLPDRVEFSRKIEGVEILRRSP